LGGADSDAGRGLAKARVLSEIFKPGKRLDALGGIAALLRYKLQM
jgi:stalled ribosome rescue protein Dom34